MDDAGLWCDLADAGDKGKVNQSLLDRASSDAAQKMQEKGLVKEVVLRLIPNGRDVSEQMEILTVLAYVCSDAKSVSMDLSHGFRHLPMLGLLSAQFLNLVHGVQIDGLYYGALEMNQAGVTPVLRLDGLLRLGQWLQALAGFRKSGDYGIFSPILKEVDEAATSQMSQAAFFEKVLNVGEARRHLKNALDRFDDISKKDPAFGLIKAQLKEFCIWTECKTYARRQLAVAQNALEAGNYPKAAALALEAIISSNMKNSGEITSFQKRKEARDELNIACNGPIDRDTTAGKKIAIYKELRGLRNAMAHGINPSNNKFNVRATLRDESIMKERLETLIQEIQKTWFAEQIPSC